MPTTRPKLAPGQQAPDFTLPATDGSRVNLAKELASHQAAVVMFICNHCPYVQAYLPRLIELQHGFPNVRFIGICSNDAEAYPEDDFEHMKQMAQDKGLNFPYVRDDDQAVARAYGAQRTPEIFVIDSQGICRYEGGIDNNYQDPEEVTDRPLRDALEAIVQGGEVERPQTWAIGCTIKWKGK